MKYLHLLLAIDFNEPNKQEISKAISSLSRWKRLSTLMHDHESLEQIDDMLCNLRDQLKTLRKKNKLTSGALINLLKAIYLTSFRSF